jgi:hypothetical protein
VKLLRNASTNKLDNARRDGECQEQERQGNGNDEESEEHDAKADDKPVFLKIITFFFFLEYSEIWLYFCKILSCNR